MDGNRRIRQRLDEIALPVPLLSGRIERVEQALQRRVGNRACPVDHRFRQFGTDGIDRLLGAFDSTLLAYASKRRQRILPEALRDVVYQKANLQIRPTFLLDGLVAGTWSIELRRREVTLTLAASRAIARAERSALTAEASGLLRALHPDAKAHHVVIA